MPIRGAPSPIRSSGVTVQPTPECALEALHDPSELSGGELARAGLAVALANSPTVLLADEPTGQLDQHNADRIISALLDTATTIGAALMISTHDPVVAARFDDQWAIRDGVLDDTHRGPR